MGLAGWKGVQDFLAMSMRKGDKSVTGDDERLQLERSWREDGSFRLSGNSRDSFRSFN